MESRKESLSGLKICRFCLSQDDNLTSLYKKSRIPKNAISLPLKILSSVGIEVYPSDKMPLYICGQCKFFMELSYEYKRICRQADENILQYIQTGTALESMTWPKSLTKIYRESNGRPSNEVAVMKSVDGTTVQVTQDLSDTDADDEENVYNIKIGDTSDEGSKNTSIKVSDKEEMPKAKPKRGTKGFSSVPKLAKHVRTHAGGKVYPCKYCDKTFIKSHHHTRHLRMKHRGNIRNRRGPFGEVEEYRCEQCAAHFGSQDDLIYHSAIHATQNLTCPLCQEKFDDVEAVTMHIKSHASGSEFMCDYCELIFTTKAKLDNHITIAHDEEMRCESLELDESSMEIDGEEDDDDNGINIKEEDGEMVLEIKKADDFMLTNYQGELEDKLDNTNSEDSEVETAFPEESTVDPLALTKKEATDTDEKSAAKPHPGTLSQSPTTTKTADKPDNQAVSIIRKAEEIKRKTIQQKTPDNGTEKKEKVISKVESTTTVGSNDKSLRLLEKELQDLKRTNTRTETAKTTSRSLETIRNRRPQIHTSTPKIRNSDEKKLLPSLKATTLEKKGIERRLITKENKEPKDIKESKNNNDKEKSVVKNGTDKSNNEEGVRRSTRPSKIKDYAKMIRERSQDSDATEDDSDEPDDDDDEEFKETEKIPEPPRSKLRRSSMKVVHVPSTSTTTSAVATATTATPRKRGRPRKEAPQIPNKLKKEDSEESEPGKQDKSDQESNGKVKQDASTSADTSNEIKKKELGLIPSPTLLVSPTGQTLKKVPVKSLPPGVKALPLPVNARLGTAEVCEMQIGQKVVKVQKIVMTKAEVDAMTKKGLVEMKGGTMVLKQGVKLPHQDAAAIKQALVDGGETNKESPSKKEKGAPSRCDLGDDTS